jgi:hypothetical protein
MIEIAVTPTAELNASKVAIQLNSAQEFGMQFSVAAFGKITDSEGNEVWGQNPLYSGLLNVTGDAWNNWLDVDDATYVGDLALAQLGLERAEVEEASEAPAEEAPEAPAEEAEETPAEE